MVKPLGWMEGAKAFALSCLFALPLSAQERPAVMATETATPPLIDGRIDDAVWSQAIPLTNFTQVEPVEGATPSQRTEMRILFDADALYIAVRNYDTEAAEILARTRRRDSPTTPDDALFLAFDTFGRGQDGYYFALTAGGAKRDGLIRSATDNDFSTQWDGIWEGRVSRDEGGWSAEFAIPTRTVAFDPAALQWRMNLMRIVRRDLEYIRWTGAVQGRPFLALADFGEIKGLKGLQQGVGLTVKPFMRAAVNDPESAAAEDGFDFRAGLDAVYQITPSLATTLTINTDFAEAEIDERIVNLTRFPISLPEKRSFFLQDASVFAFGGIDRAPYPYFSRRIGLSPSGEPVDLLGGLKITGRIGSVAVGALGVVQDAFANVAQKELFVGRIAYLWGEGSSAGLILTEGEPRAPGENHAIGADFNGVYAVRGGEQRLILNSWIVRSDSDLARAEDYAAAFNLRLEGEPWNGRVRFRHVGEDYDPGLGFVGRRAFNEYFFGVQRVWRPHWEGIRVFETSFDVSYLTNLDGQVESANVELPGVFVSFDRGGWIYAETGLQREVLFDPFAIADGIIIPTGTYDWPYVECFFATSSARRWSVEGGIVASQFYEGERVDYELELGLRPAPGLEIELFVEHRDIRLDGGELSIWIGSLGVDYAVTPDLVLNFLAQYDNVSDELGANARLRWTFRPGSDLFLVVNQGWDTADKRFRATNADISLKGSYSWRF